MVKAMLVSLEGELLSFRCRWYAVNGNFLNYSLTG